MVKSHAMLHVRHVKELAAGGVRAPPPVGLDQSASSAIGRGSGFMPFADAWTASLAAAAALFPCCSSFKAHRGEKGERMLENLGQ